jgi:HEAT repeat protein
MQPKIVTSITCVKCGGVMTGSEKEFTVTCPYCAVEYIISIAATVVLPADIDERVRQLLACVLDGNPRERHEAALELEKIRDARIIPPVIEAMDVLWKRMDKIGSYEELNPLYFALRKIILYIGIPEAAENLIKLLSDENSNVRDLAASALMRAVNPAAVEPLIRAAADPDLNVRASAAMALGSYSDERIHPVLVSLLDDKSPRVIEAALRSAGKVKCTDAAERVIVIFNTKNERYEDHTSWDDVRRAAVCALSDICTDETVMVLIDALKDDKPMIRNAILQELQSLQYRVENKTIKNRIENILETG